MRRAVIPAAWVSEGLVNVTLITMAYPHPRAGHWPGIERQAAGFATALRDAGARVSVITSFRNGGEAQEVHDGISIFRVPDSAHRFGRLGYVMNLHVRTLGHNALALTDVLERSDVVESFIPLPVGAKLRALKPAVFAFFPHRDRPLVWTEYLIHPENFRMEKRFYREATKVIVASTESRRVLLQEYGVPESRIEVVPLGLAESFVPFLDAPRPTDDRAGDDGERPIRLLYVGLLIPRKGLGTLIEALPLVRQAGVRFQAILAGHGPDKEGLMRRARDLGVGDMIEFPGRVGDRELPDLYRGADLFVFPSTKEGFGLVLVEAMACGLPVVTTALAPMTEVVGEAGLFFRPGDPADLANAIVKAARDPELRSRMRSEGSRRVRERFMWSRVAERSIEIYRRARAA